MAVPGRRKLVQEASDRLEELDERIAIMSEPTATDALNNIKSAFDNFCKDADEMIQKNKTDP